jgi:ABC-type polysaccharide/polyol phosphate transport system ATPase subunit
LTAAIELHGVGKRYMQLQEQAMLLRSLLPFARRTKTERWALKDVDLRIDEGETVGILGRNGAGKTTLLRLLAGVSQPTAGRLRIVGRIAPLISVGVGFHQEMSGRENIYVNGMLLGLTKAEVEARFDDIVAFAELDEFIDTPVKFYSSGMFMRLGFSVAIHVEPQVLLVDEVLAVGDIAFQLKCLDRMRALQQLGATILLVSHSMHSIRLLCPRALVFRKGRLEFDGDAESAISRHHELLSMDAATSNGNGTTGGAGPGSVTVLEGVLLGPEGPTNHPRQDDIVSYRVRLQFFADVDSPQVQFQVWTDAGSLVYCMHTTVGQSWRRYRAGEIAEVEVSFQPRLGGGTYRLATAVTDRDGTHVLCSDPVGTLIYLAPPLGSVGVADLRASITVDSRPRSDHKDMLLGSPVGAAPRLDQERPDS